MGFTFNRNASVIFALGMLASGIFFVLSLSIPLGSDAMQYDRMGLNISLGRGLSLSEESPFVPTMFREPGYPVFLSVFYALFGHNIFFPLFGQMILHSVTAVMAYYMSRDIVSGAGAFISGVFIALFPTLANASVNLLSETVFTFLLVAACYALISGVKTGKAGKFALAGIICGALALTKASAVLLPAALALALIPILIFRKWRARRLVICLAAFLCVFSVIIAGWAFRNKARFDTYSITLRGAEALWARAEKIDKKPKEVLADACYNFSEYLGGRFFPDPAVRPERYMFQDFEKAKALREEYSKKGFTYLQVESIFKDEAILKIKKNMLKYAGYTFIEMIKMTSFTYLPILNEPSVMHYFSKIPKGITLLSVIKGVIRIMAYPILLIFAGSVIRNRSDWDRWLLLFAAVAYFNLVCSLLDAIGRYAVPLIPFYCIMALGFFYPQNISTKGVSTDGVR